VGCFLLVATASAAQPWTVAHSPEIGANTSLAVDQGDPNEPTLVVASTDQNKLLRVFIDGRTEVIAGGGETVVGPDGVAVNALAARLKPTSPAVLRDGRIAFINQGDHHARQPSDYWEELFIYDPGTKTVRFQKTACGPGVFPHLVTSWGQDGLLVACANGQNDGSLVSFEDGEWRTIVDGDRYTRRPLATFEEPVPPKNIKLEDPTRLVRTGQNEFVLIDNWTGIFVGNAESVFLTWESNYGPGQPYTGVVRRADGRYLLAGASGITSIPSLRTEDWEPGDLVEPAAQPQPDQRVKLHNKPVRSMVGAPGGGIFFTEESHPNKVQYMAFSQVDKTLSTLVKSAIGAEPVDRGTIVRALEAIANGAKTKVVKEIGTCKAATCELHKLRKMLRSDSAGLEAMAKFRARAAAEAIVAGVANPR
jgi:hypothetical protein